MGFEILVAKGGYFALRVDRGQTAFIAPYSHFIARPIGSEGFIVCTSFYRRILARQEPPMSPRLLEYPPQHLKADDAKLASSKRISKQDIGGRAARRHRDEDSDTDLLPEVTSSRRRLVLN